MRFDDTFPDKLKSQIKLSDIISKKISIKSQSPGKFIALCPFHKEKTPSFHIDDQKEFYHCFGCGAHGNMINFVMESENLPFFEAVTKIADDHNITIPYIKNTQTNPIEKQKKDRSFEIQMIISQFFEDNLYNQYNQHALHYLYSRSLGKEIIKKFKLGFAPKESKKLLSFLLEKDFSEQEIIESGVFNKKDNNIYCRFRNRVIFPISNNKNQIIAYGGRILDDSMPKYLNSPETKLFHKRQNLYNFYNAKNNIYNKKYAILVEGYMDVISLDNHKIYNAVAPLGTSVTLEQLNILFNITSEVVVCLDGDEAGIRGGKRIIDLTLPIINANNNVKFAFLPDKMDPDDFLQINGRDKMLNLLENSKNLSEILFQFEINNLSIDSIEKIISPEKKTILEDNLNKKIELIKDPKTKRNFKSYYNNLLFSIGRAKKKTNNITIKKNYINFNFNKNKNKNLILGLNILNLIINIPQLSSYSDEDITICEIEFSNDILDLIKEEVFETILNKGFSQGKIKDFIIENISNDQDLIKEKIFAKNNITELDLAIIQIKILYFKILHKNIELEYQEHSKKIQNYLIEEKEIIDSDFNKSQELYNYKTQLEQKILNLEKKFNI